MASFAGKFVLIAAATLAGLGAISYYGLEKGIDLSGGTILVYQAKGSTKSNDFKLDELVSALKKRVNPEGVGDVPIRKIGSNRLEIILPEASPEKVQEVKDKITTVGSLEFRILANKKHDSAAIARALAPKGLTDPPRRYKWAILGETTEGKAPKRIDSTHLADVRQQWLRDRYIGSIVTLTGKDATGQEATESAIVEANTANTLTLKAPMTLSSVSSYKLDYNPSAIFPSDDAIVRDQPRGNGATDRYILCVEDKQNVTGDYLINVRRSEDERLQPAVGFSFTAAGGRKFATLTREHEPEERGAFQYRLAILLDNVVRSAPSIRTEIRDSGIITGIPPREIPRLIEILQSGSLPASIDPTPLLEEKIGPTLGKDTIEKGITAISIALMIVPIFMIAYYRFAGVVSVVALVINMILLIGSMAFLHASFTLPGLAGTALTIGMAVDANVLIFERMREEAERGASLGQQIRNGFSRAWVTILDSHLTIFLSGLVLYIIGTEEIKGFALTLLIGMIWNLFTAVYVSRVIFDFWYDQGWLKRISMFKILDKTRIDFITPKKYLIPGSITIILLGLAIFAYRRNQMFNIDFTGGTLITIRLDDKAPAIKDLSESDRAAYVRSEAAKVLTDPAVETLNVGSERRGVRFNIRTTETNIADVQKKILQEFGPVLARLEMNVGASTPVPEAKAPAPPPAEASKKDAATPAPTPNPFAGGRSYALTFNRPVDPASIRAAFSRVLAAAKVPNPDSRFAVARADESVTPDAIATTSDKLVLTTNLDPDPAKADLGALATALRDDPNILFDRQENFGGAVAGETRNLAIIAVVASWLIIIAYVWLRFKNITYGMAAVIALVHDVLITLGAVAISPYKIDLPMVAAFLTLIGFSTNDTIVIFDRIRELKGKSPYLTKDLVNRAVNETLSRTILTSLTAWMVVVVMYVFGGEGLHGFSFCLVVGFLSGTYSTVYIASPILIDWIGGVPKDAPSRKPEMATREV